MTQTTTVLRLETHDTGIGIYQSLAHWQQTFSPAQFVKYYGMMYSLANDVDDNQPTPDEDGIFSFDEDDYFGFADEEQMFKWFSRFFIKSTLDEMGSIFGLYAYEIRTEDISVKTDSQVVFKKERALARMLIA